MKTLKHALIVYKVGNSQAEKTAFDIQHWFYNRNITSNLFSSDIPETQLKQALVHTQVAIILGGDGTFLSISRNLIEKQIPALGINFGQVGFLVEIHPENWPQTLEQLYSHKLVLQKKIVLSWSIVRQSQIIKSGFAINDVVVGRGALARVLAVDVSINKQNIGTIRSDGILVSTPLGTSGYTISAHGPLVHPNVQALTITSVSTLFRSTPPLVLPLSTTITLTPSPHAIDPFLTVDGQEGFVLKPNDSVGIQGIKNGLLIYTTANYNYLQHLQKKGLLSFPTTSNLLKY